MKKGFIVRNKENWNDLVPKGTLWSITSWLDTIELDDGAIAVVIGVKTLKQENEYQYGVFYRSLKEKEYSIVNAFNEEFELVENVASITVH